MTTATAAPSLARYRTNHKIEPVPGRDGLQRCATDGVPVYRVLTQRWQHDQNVLQRLIREELAADLAAKCYRCGRPIPKGSTEDELAISVDLGGTLGLKCSYCQDKDADL